MEAIWHFNIEALECKSFSAVSANCYSAMYHNNMADNFRGVLIITPRACARGKVIGRVVVVVVSTKIAISHR